MHITPSAGTTTVLQEITKCVGIATMLDETVWLTFNGTQIAIRSGNTPDQYYTAWLEQREKDQAIAATADPDEGAPHKAYTLTLYADRDTGEIVEVRKSSFLQDQTSSVYQAVLLRAVAKLSTEALEQRH